MTGVVHDEVQEWLEAVERVLGGETGPDLVERVARGYVVALSDGSLARRCPHDRLERLGRLLVLQEHVDIDPPALHTVIANHQSGGHPEIIDRAAEQLGPLLRELVAEPSPAKNAVLMVVLLRHGAALGIDQGEVSRLHLAYAAAFTPEDLSLPYSCAFTHVYDRNRDDIVAVLSDPGRRDDFVAGLSDVHRLVDEWLTGIPVEPTDPAPGDAAAQDDPAVRDGVIADAWRSLVVRRAGTAAVPAVAEGDERLARLLAGVRERRASLPAADDGRTAAAAERLEDRRWMAVHGGAAMAARTLRVPTSRLPGRRRPRVAVCVSGQLRGYRAAYETWSRSLLAAADCDLFVHTWANVGRSSAEGFRSTLPFAGAAFSDAYRGVALAVGFDEVKGRYPTLFAHLERSEHVDAPELSEFYGTDHVVVDDDGTEAFDGWSNQDKMHWKIQSAHELAVASGREYDLVVRVRPDKPIVFTAFAWRDLLEVCTRSATVLADAPRGVHYAKLVIGDQFAIGSPEAMALYSRTYSLYPALAGARLSQCPPELSGHSSLAQVCWVHGIDVRRVPMKFGTLQEVSPLGTAEVLECIQADAAGRMDASDRELLTAARADV